MDSALKDLIGQGVLGIITVILFYWVWQKDKTNDRLRDEHDATIRAMHEKQLADQKADTAARVADATNYTNLALKLQSEANAQVNRLSDVFEEFRRLAPALMPQPQRERYDDDVREAARRRPTMQAPRERELPAPEPEVRESTELMPGRPPQPQPPRGRYGSGR